MLLPLIPSLFTNGVVTCFAYGQTGSGKTFTMKGVQEEAIKDLFTKGPEKFKDSNPEFYVSYFEIYRGRVHDLLNDKEKVEIMEDHNNEVQVQGLREVLVKNESELQECIDSANSIRTTHSTKANDESSRSHAVCQIIIRNSTTSAQLGKLKLVDLAGSERAQDTQSNNRQRRLEGADINKSLLALKECIRAFDTKKNSSSDVHVPFRASKLTMILKDSFNSKNEFAKIVMIACINPGSSSADHTLNTLRYSGRLKTSFDKPSSALGKMKEISNLRRIESDRYNPDSIGLNLPPRPDAKSHMNSNADSIGSQIKTRASRDSNQHSRAGMAGIGRMIISGDSSSSKSLTRERNLTNGRQTRNSRSRDGRKLKSPPKRNSVAKRKNDFLDPSSKEKDDIDYLRQTLRGHENMYENQEMLDLAEKADKLMQEQDELISSHSLCVKEHNKLVKLESKLISKTNKGSNEEDGFEDYIDELELILKKRREIDDMLMEKIKICKSLEQ